MHPTMYAFLGLLVVFFGVLYLVRPFNIFCPLRIYRKYPKVNGEAAPITILQYRKKSGRRSKEELYGYMKKAGLAKGEETDMKIARTELKLPPAMSLQSEIRPGVVAVIHAGHEAKYHCTEERDHLSFGEYDLYVCIPSENARVRNIQPSRQRLSVST